MDYLVARKDVDAARIGATGVSLGGMHAWLLAFADPRVACCAPAIGVQWFDWAVRHDKWQGRVDSIKPVFEVAAAQEGKAAVGSSGGDLDDNKAAGPKPVTKGLDSAL
ncbi:unnamed protein product [Heterosigma akashiwo]